MRTTQGCGMKRTLGHELKTLNAKASSALWNEKNDSRSREFMALNTKHISGLWNEKNDSRS